MNHKVTLPDDVMQMIDAQVQSGRYANAEDVVRAAIAHLTDQPDGFETDADWLRKAWDAGIASGGFAPVDLDKIKTEGRARLKAAQTAA
jgi:antitoxin ParD1/3/4